MIEMRALHITAKNIQYQTSLIKIYIQLTNKELENKLFGLILMEVSAIFFSVSEELERTFYF